MFQESFKDDSRVFTEIFKIYFKGVSSKFQEFFKEVTVKKGPKMFK